MKLLYMNVRPTSFLLTALILVVLPVSLFAHEAIVVKGETEAIVVTDPEVGRVYLGELKDGASATYRVVAKSPWNLYLSLLVPRSSNPDGKYDAMLYDVGRERIVAVLERGDRPWYPYYELFGADRYLRGPVLLKSMPEGEFKIIVTGPENIGRYALVLGDEEKFALGDVFDSIGKMAENKRNFFDVSPVTLIASPIALVYAISLLSIGAIFGRVLRYGAGFFRKNKGTPQAKTNLRRRDIWVRYLLGAITLLLCVTTTWNPFLFIVSGFLFYEGLTGWCGLVEFLCIWKCDAK